VSAILAGHPGTGRRAGYDLYSRPQAVGNGAKHYAECTMMSATLCGNLVRGIVTARSVAPAVKADSWRGPAAVAALSRASTSRRRWPVPRCADTRKAYEYAQVTRGGRIVRAKRTSRRPRIGLRAPPASMPQL